MSDYRVPTTQQHIAKEGTGIVTYVTAAQTLKPYENVVEFTQLAASFAVTLPNVAEAAGRFFSLHVVDANSEAVTLQDQDESVDWSNLTIDADADGVLLYSDGRKWWIVTNDIA